MEYQGIIYKISNNKNDLVYIGSTTKPMNPHLNRPETLYKQKTILLNGHDRLYWAVKEIGIDNFQVEVIEDLGIRGNELKARAGYYIMKYNSIEHGYNSRLPSEYFYGNDNKEKMKEYRKEKIECPICKITVRRDEMKHHLTTKKHKLNASKQ